MGPIKTVTAHKEITYNLHMLENIFSLNNSLLLAGRNSMSENCFVIIDKTVYSLYRLEIEEYFSHNVKSFYIHQVDAKEINKNLNNLLEILKELNNYPIKRRCEPIIIIGGGVVTDLAAFGASCFRRGIPHIKVPTTLMGYVDASIGIKTSINFGNFKNRLGSFFEPHSVLLDKKFFKTLSDRDIPNGVGEIIKIAVIKNSHLFRYLENNSALLINTKFQAKECDYVLEASINDMVEELEPNLFENNLERIVDFGHTFSLAFEMEPGSDIKHGEAVAMDVFFSSFLSYGRKLLSFSDLKRITQLIYAFNLSIKTELFNPQTMWASIKEKMCHRDGEQKVPIPSSIGKSVFLNDITTEELSRTLKAIELSGLPEPGVKPLALAMGI